MNLESILVVDDDETICQDLRMMLEENGYMVDLAHTGKEAIRRSFQKFYDAALIDIGLPDVNGIDLLSQLREDIPKMTKVIITGSDTLENAVKALNKGCDAYITKPFKPDEILLTLRKELKYRKANLKMTQEKVTNFARERLMVLESEFLSTS